MVTDLVHLNKFVKRPIHPFKPPKDIIALVDPDAKYFATFDAKLAVTKFALERTNLHSQLEIKQNSLFHLIASSLMSELN